MSIVKPQQDGAFFKPPREFKRRDPRGWPIGPRQKRRARENRTLNKLPREITHRCEVQIESVCIGNRYLTWSHALKSRHLVNSRDWQRAARSCQPCHQYCEDKMSAKQRAATIDAAIKRRKPPL
jgi:hypothetical protein